MVTAAVTLVVGVSAGVALGRSDAAAPPSGDWLAFGRTPDQNRYSPLTQITPANVDQLGRVYTVDFRQRDPDVRNGQQSYPLAIGGTLYVTTNDANVFAIDGPTGRTIWQRKPLNSAVFKNFGVAANRGLAYCGGRLFILQLDMKLVAMSPRDRRGPGRGGTEPGRAERDRQLRLLADERPDVRQQHARLRRRRLGARQPRLRDGVHAEPQAGVAVAVLDDPARPHGVAPVAARRRRPGVDACHDRQRPPTRSSSAPAAPLPSTTRPSAPGRTRAPARSSPSTCVTAT